MIPAGRFTGKQYEGFMMRDSVATLITCRTMRLRDE